MRLRAALALVGVTLAAAACGRAPDGDAAASPSRDLPARALLRAMMVDRTAFERAVALTAARTPRPMHGARAVIVPHHWLAGELILSTLRDAAAAGPWERVVLIGPNHPDAGSAAAITSDRSWRTPRGPVHASADAVARLTSRGLARMEAPVLEREHSVSGLIAAIRVAMPRAQIVPVILRSHQRLGGLTRLASALRPLLDDRTLVVASVDFSHGLTAREARARGRETIEALDALDAPDLLRMGNEHLDSPSTMVVVVQAMRAIGATVFHLRENTDASAFGAAPNTPSTGYVTGYFSTS